MIAISSSWYICLIIGLYSDSIFRFSVLVRSRSACVIICFTSFSMVFSPAQNCAFILYAV